MTKKISNEEYRRNLPHIQPQGAMFFVTLRLYNSIPISKLELLKESYLNNNTTDISGNAIKQLKKAQQDDYFLAFDDFLDTNPNGPYYLAIPEIARLVGDSITYRDGKDYKLVCYCIMSNHVHMIIYKLAKPLDLIMKELKSFSGKEALHIIRESEQSRSLDSEAPSEQSGQGASLNIRKFSQQVLQVPILRVPTKFWQAESFDRIVRDRNDMAEKIKYTLTNPVKAGLVDDWNKWEWSYCQPEFLE
jgi:REP element-mobilizing transposase RayT